MSILIKKCGGIFRSDVNRMFVCISRFCENFSKNYSIQNYIQKRNLHIHEGDALNLLDKYDINHARCARAYTVEEATEGALSIGSTCDYIVKAQVLAGGRGLGKFKENNFQGGVHLCSSIEEVKDVSTKMIGKTLITKQTGEAGKICNSVLICERFYLKTERYVAILLDREGPLLVGSSIGGSSIEDIAEKDPDSIKKLTMKDMKIDEKKLKQFCEDIGFIEINQNSEACKIIKNLYNLFIQNDVTLIEINPFAVTETDEIMVCDIKINIDDNAFFRQEELFRLHDSTQEDPRETNAAEHNLNYVGLDGDIGCMVNGAGLAMATMDIIKLHGGFPANFLDVGGGADQDQVVNAFRLLQNDPGVKAILVNIFGGIMRCDIIAQGIINASKDVDLTKPLIVRLQGTNQELAKELLLNSIKNDNIRMIFTSDLDIAAKKAVASANIVTLAQEADLKIEFV